VWAVVDDVGRQPLDSSGGDAGRHNQTEGNSRRVPGMVSAVRAAVVPAEKVRSGRLRGVAGALAGVTI
jgi:hypothetical protein